MGEHKFYQPIPDHALCAVGLFLWRTPMTQQELDQEIANQTGESIHTINAMGFSQLRSVIPVEERQTPLVVDWDEVDRIRNSRGSF